MPGAIILFILCGMIWIYFAHTRRPVVGYLGYVFLFMFLGRGLICLLNGVYEILPILMDALNYHESSWLVAYYLHQGDLPGLYKGIVDLKILEPGYTLVLGFFYYIFGSKPVVGFLMNTFCFGFTSYNVYRIGDLLFGPKAARVGVLFFMLLPYTILHSTYLYRDPIINCFLSELFYRFLVISKTHKQSLYEWMWIVFVFIFSGILRRENLVIFTAIVGFLILLKILRMKSFLTPIIITVAVAVVVVGGLFIYSNQDSWFLKNFTSLIQVEMLSKRVEGLQESQSAYLKDQKYSSYWDVIRYAPIRAVYFMFSPFPWDIFKKSQWLSFGEGAIIGIVMLFLPKGLWRARKEYPSFFWAASIFLVVGIIGSGLIQSNSAGAQRHRTQFTFLIVAIAVPYCYHIFLRRLTLFGKYAKGIYPSHRGTLEGEALPS